MPFPWLLAAAAAPVIIKGIRKDRQVGTDDWARLLGAAATAGISHAANASKAASATKTVDALVDTNATNAITPATLSSQSDTRYRSGVPPKEQNKPISTPKTSTEGADKGTGSIAKENGFFNQELIPGTTNAKFLEMAVKGVADRYTLLSTENACQANIDDHTERHRSEASGNVTSDYNTVMNSGACRSLAATRAKAQGQTPRDMSEIMKRYDAATALENQVTENKA